MRSLIIRVKPCTRRGPYCAHGVKLDVRKALLALLLACSTNVHAVTVVPLNDTGQSVCYDGSGAVAICTSTATDDGRYGRDAANTAGQLAKAGAGSAGLDLTKIANSGTVLAAGAALGSNPTDWACTQDNVTSLTWEVKTTSGLRSNVHTYTWYSTDAASNGGAAGSLGTDTCGGTLSAYSNQCNTANYIAAVNAAALCGYSDWRLPGRTELLSVVDFSVPATGVAPAVDAIYFPNTQPAYYSSATNYWSAMAAWQVDFNDGKFGNHLKSASIYVRLVRGGQ